MKYNNRNLNNEKKAVEVLKETLSQVPFLQIQEVRNNVILSGGKTNQHTGSGIAVLVWVRLSSCEEQQLLVEVKTSGQPRYVNQAINSFLRYKDRFPGAYYVFMAPYISPRSAEICKNEGMGYIDFSGNCGLSFKNVFVERYNYPSLFQGKRELHSLFSPRATRVLRVLLDNPRKAWKVQELSRQAGVSLGLASNIKKRLREQEFILEEDEGIVLKEPEQLLHRWSENYTYEDNTLHLFYSIKPIAVLESEIAAMCENQCLLYALAGFSAAARIAPSVRYQQAMIFIEGDALDKVATLYGLKPAERGANVSLWQPYDESVFYASGKKDGITIVAPEQIYLDLNRYPGRGEESAETILEEVLRPRWQI